MRDAVATEFRRLRIQLDRAERRIATGRLSGKVAQVDPQKRLLRLKIGTSSSGEDILSPWVRWQEAAAGGLRIHSEPAIGEQMDLVSRSGTVGDLSIAVPATYDKDNQAPSASSDTAVFERGAGRLEIGADGILLKGPVKVEGPVEIEGDRLRHNSRNVGSTHVHGGVERGGANTDVPSN
ncbi:phage-related baseplate assembly protein [Rhizobium etli 8C-3]|uniref:Phage-related baseplate assembly protein n=1 Tax=Rhizobium etli 8C-3 TaxID=538025 RepID=A0A1L5P7D6_RHIET|nr:phage baseplate assembly protein V [Rhizobium etli]APO76109.1 phage-related baseplate assembly protein [Rhizobium etli 8C-3]